MNPKYPIHIAAMAIGLVALLSIIQAPTSLSAQNTAFTYQGRLGSAGSPVDGTYDFVFTVYASSNGVNDSFANWTNSAVGVSNGLFAVSVDFGASVFNGDSRWLQIDVRTNGNGIFTPLSPRQKLTPAPYAITAENVASGGLAGTFTNAVNFNNAANSFSGNGAGLINLNAQTLGGLGTNGFWRTTGNAGTLPGPNFLGTADNQPLELQVNGTRALRLEPHGASAPSLVGGYFQNSVSGFLGAVIAGGGTSGSASGVSGNYAFIGAGHGANAGSYSAVIGGAYNNSPANFSFIGTGFSNTNLGDYSFVGAGQYNNNEGAFATIGGGYNNRIQTNTFTSVIAGGHENLIQSSASYSLIGSGGYHIIGTNAYDSFIGGGGYNKIENEAHSSVIAGGAVNLVGTGSAWAAIGGGEYNTNNSVVGTIAGGYDNNIQINATGSFIGGGYDNTIQSNAFASLIGGGRGNLIQVGAFDSTIGGGPFNLIQTNANASTIGGGYINFIGHSAGASTISGGVGNGVLSNAIGSAVGGGYYNFIQLNAASSVIGGGSNNFIATPYSVVGGGENNSARGEYSAVSGGGYNQAAGRGSFVGGGGGRDAFGGGPYGNAASGDWSTVGGGWSHQASGYSSTVSGGALNLATNTYATVPGGGYNVAGGSSSFAAGFLAYALHQGSFVWGDSQSAIFPSTGNDQFLIRSAGGVGINKNNPATALDVNGIITASGFSGPGGNLVGLNAAQITSGTLPDARLSANIATLNGAQTFTGAKTFSAPSTFNAASTFNSPSTFSNFVGIGTSSGIGAGSLIVSANTSSFAGMYVNSAANGLPFYGYAQNGSPVAYSYVDGGDANKWKLFGPGAGISLTVATSGNVGIGITAPTNKLHVAGGVSATAFVSTSDRAAKENFKPISPRSILAKVADLPISTWTFKEMKDGEHLGPVAQDFYASFGLGGSERTITTTDEGGVALAAIQGLNQKVDEKDGEIQNLKRQNQSLEARVSQMEALLKQLTQAK